MGKVSKRTVGFVIAYAFSGKDLRTGGLPGFGRKCFEDFCQIFLPMAVEFGKDLIEPETDGVRDKVLLEMFILRGGGGGGVYNFSWIGGNFLFFGKIAVFMLFSFWLKSPPLGWQDKILSRCNKN
ncbi:hypothetical protein [Neisseria meningitidis]|uniref:hypothetical protein n=1 Tax=Neisseria meningitidis TaxID=487 RepID=UPI0021F45C84|nr:hypothetical protein [Neisseria meningitidis]MCV6754373.1 hypothetical protein [Neisseria meningitidis]